MQAAQGLLPILRQGWFLSVAVSIGEGLESWCKLELSSRQEKQRWRGFQLCCTGGMELCPPVTAPSYPLMGCIMGFAYIVVWSQSSGTYFWYWVWLSVTRSMYSVKFVLIIWFHTLKCNNVRFVCLYLHWSLNGKCFIVTLQVMEETGFDIAPKLRLDDHLEVLIGQQRMRLYIIPSVRDDTRFAPLTKKEISVCFINQETICWSFLIFSLLKYMPYAWLLHMPLDIFWLTCIRSMDLVLMQPVFCSTEYMVHDDDSVLVMLIIDVLKCRR